MKNWEYYKDEIKKHDFGDFAMIKNNFCVDCGDICCGECKFYSEKDNIILQCDKRKTEFLYKEYGELFKLTRLEYELLKEFVKEYSYIVRNKANNSLSIHLEKPYRHISELRWSSLDENYQLNYFFNKFFKFIEWEFQPINIQDILDNCVVIE